MTARETLLPRWLWLWFPPLLAIIVLGSKLISQSFFDQYIEGEMGLTELATPVAAFAGVVAGLMTLRWLRWLPSRQMQAWFILVILGCFYLGGEELSWGQQLVHWKTPTAIDALNNQHETNLHNMSSWFDQKPRMLLELWVLIGGVMLPLRRLARDLPPGDDGWGWFWPPLDCLPTAALAIAIKLPQRYKVLVGLDVLPFEIRWSEPQEYYFALFLFLYVLAIRARLKARMASADS